MDRFFRNELRELMEDPGGPCVSLTLPTARSGPETQQGPIRLKNLLRQAEEGLVAIGLRPTEARDRLAAVEALLADSAFWRAQSDGLAIFVDPDGGVRRFRVPLALDEAVVVGPRFAITPLLPLVAVDGHFYVLALSQNQVRLLRGTRHRIAETGAQGMPANLADTLREDETEQQLQLRSGGAGAAGGAIFHGHGGVADAEDARLRRYVHAIDRAVTARLADERAPLVLAGVESLVAAYREVNHYAHVAAESIPGSPDRVADAALHAASWAIVEPTLRAAMDAAGARIAERLGTGEATANLPEIVRAAHEGRVDTLFLAEGATWWGTFDAATGDVALLDGASPGTEALGDLAAARTAVAGGQVYVVAPEDVPGGAEAAALLRY